MDDDKDSCDSNKDDLPTQLEEDDNREENDAATENRDQKNRNPCIGQACGDASIEQSRELLEVLQRNPEFTVLPQSEQQQVFAELLENEVECEYLLNLMEEESCNDAGGTSTEEGNKPSKQKGDKIKDTSIITEESLHPRETDKQQRLPEPGKDDCWANEPEDNANPETVDYWIQLIRNLTKEESNGLLNDLSEELTNDPSNDDFDDSTWDEAAVQPTNNSVTKEEAIDLVQNNNEGARPADDLGSISPLQEQTSTQNDASPPC
ncbi:hypothetical protein H4582DRAFT_2086432 [Lactarius indigo]|nr:hypothetical protein H4582DRAFT_2086432 [Lactarius indigo]